MYSHINSNKSCEQNIEMCFSCARVIAKHNNFLTWSETKDGFYERY